jgi:hypothetical protein
MAAQAPEPNLPGAITNRPQSLRNTFFHARPDGTYAEIANYAGLAASEWAWQPVFVDIDLDGRMDLLVTSGHAHDVQDRDAELKVRARQKNYGAIANAAERRRVFAADLLENMRIYPPLQTPIVAFRNSGGLRFEDVTDRWGTHQPGTYHGIALADFDGDGDLDFAVNNMNSAAGLYRNNASAPRLAVRLAGLPPNSMAIGARAVLRDGAEMVQRQEVIADQLASLQAERNSLEQRVSLLRPDTLDRDTIDEMARRNLSVMKRDEVMIILDRHGNTVAEEDRGR